jgi:glycosyltransferase involved in cell wall biosynthesis
VNGAETRGPRRAKPVGRMPPPTRVMVLGLLPEIRGGLAELAKTGQHTRFLAGYLKRYARSFEEIRYFSYVGESLGAYTDDPDLLARLRLFPGGVWHPWLYTVLLPLRYRRELRGCAVLRVFHVTGVVPALVAKRLYGIPFVTTYGYRYSKFGARSWLSGRLRGWVEALGLAGADAVIVTTPELAAHVAQRVPEAKIHLIPNGVDTTLFRPTVPVTPASASRRPAHPIKDILYVGRLVEQKNLATLIVAAGKLVGRFDLRLTLVGDGPLRGRLEALAGTLGVPMRFLSFVDHQKLPEFLAGADAFVLPSVIEGHPKALLEAMSCGVPCLASDVEGVRSMVTDGETGLLFDPRDPDALAAGLERVLTDEEFARNLGERARARVVERFDLASLVAREIALLRRVAADRSS